MTTDTAPPPPPPPARPASPTPRLTRRSEEEDRLVAGVAGGLADHFGLDPLIVRIGFVLLALFGGSGVAIYAVLWLLVPLRGEQEPVANRFVREGQARIGSERGLAFWVGAALIAVAGIAILDEVVDGTLAWALVLIVVGVLLFRSDDLTSHPRDREATLPGPRAGWARGGTAGAAVSAADGSQPSGAMPYDVLDKDVAGGASAFADADQVGDTVPPLPPRPVHAPTPPRPPRPPRERSTLGRLTLGVAVLWVGGALLFNSLDLGTSVTAAGIVGIAMAIVGGGLVVGGWLGRARWLVLVGVLMVPALGAATVADNLTVHQAAGIGLRHVDVRPGATLVQEEWFAGDLQIHLTDLPPDHGDVRVLAQLGFGELEVIVPQGWGVELAAEVGAGEIAVRDFDEWFSDASGLGASIARTIAVPDPGFPTVTLDLSTDFGQVTVIRSYVAYGEVS